MLAVDRALANVHTATIAKVTRVNASTVDCKPVISRVVNGGNIELPEFVDVPPITMQGGGSYTAYPIAVGDYCMLIFTERCFDRWYHGQDNQPPLEARMHDYSDGFALVGINPLASAKPIPGDMTTVNGDVHYLNSLFVDGSVEVQQDLTVHGSAIFDQNVTVTGTLTVGGVIVNGHTHSDPQGGSTGPMA